MSMSMRARISALVAILLTVTVGSVGYVLYERQAQAESVAAAPKVPVRDDLSALRAAPHLVFRNTALGDKYGLVAVTPLTNPDGPRAMTGASCDRIYATTTDAICLSADRGLVTTYKAKLLDQSWAERRDLPLAGIPSRARLSADGSLVATTAFVFGDSYANPGQFSTRTVVSTVDGKVLGDIEQFDLVVDGRVITAADKNLWGVTFAGGNRFYATAASGGKTWLVEGDLAAKRVTALRSDVECPSLSPDGTRIAFKKHGKLPAGKWRLAVYDLKTGKETVLAEQRSVDDQAVWLDNSRVLYGLPRDGSDRATSDIWSVPADGTGTPQILVHDAWSPAVVQ
jgi:hypothetical protein